MRVQTVQPNSSKEQTDIWEHLYFQSGFKNKQTNEKTNTHFSYGVWGGWGYRKKNDWKTYQLSNWYQVAKCLVSSHV